MILGYVITSQVNGGSPKFLGIDEHSDDSTYWSPLISSAKIFSSAELASDFMNISDFTESYTYTDGTVYPPRLISEGTNIISVCPITLGEDIKPKVIIGVKLKPKGFTY